MTVLLPPTVWVCANGCPAMDRTPGSVANRFHSCPALGGLTAPLVAEGSRVRVRAVEREDYEDGQVVQRDADGRPMQSVITERPDGSNDIVVLAPTAVWSAQGVM
jgi:hypothetical protein